VDERHSATTRQEAEVKMRVGASAGVGGGVKGQGWASVVVSVFSARADRRAAELRASERRILVGRGW